MINVLHILSDSNIGGAGIYVAELSKALDKNVFNVFVACPKGAKVIDRIDSSVNIISVGITKDKSFSPHDIRHLIKIIKENHIDIVHTHASFSGRIAGWLCGKKIIYTRHTPYYSTDISSIKKLFNKLINKIFTNKIIAVSEYVKNQLIATGVDKNLIMTVLNGIDINKYNEIYDTQSIKDNIGLKDEFILLQIGRLEVDKGHEYLLRVIPYLKKDKYNIKLLLVGDGSLRKYLEDLVNDLGISKQVNFLGYVEDIKPLIAISDVFVLPSINEALSIALLEAMCMNKPCIASEVGGIPEVINESCGILVSPKDTTGLKDAVIKLYDNIELVHSMGNTGRQIVITNFNILKMTTQVEDIYLDLVSK